MLIASLKRKVEKFHISALLLSDLIKELDYRGIASALILIELPGALATTTMPVEKIFEAEASVQENFNLEIQSYENYIDKTVDLMIEYRTLKTQLKIGAADFHHLATSIKEQCKIFVTTDEHHLLREKTKQAFQKYLEILDPTEAVQVIKK